MAGVALFDADGTLHEGYALFPVFQAFADENYITQSDSNRLNEIYEDYQGGALGFKQFLSRSLLTTAEVLKGRRAATATHIANLYFESSYKEFAYVKPTVEA